METLGLEGPISQIPADAQESNDNDNDNQGKSSARICGPNPDLLLLLV